MALSAWMSASSFAGSPRCTFTLTRNVAVPAVVLSEVFRLLPIKYLRLALLLTSLSHLNLPIFLQLSAALGCRTNKTWILSQGCRVMPRQRPLVPDGSSWIFLFTSHLPVLPFTFFSQVHIICSHFPPFLVRSNTRCDCASEAMTSQYSDLCAHPVFPLDTCQSYLTFVLST